MLVAIQIHKLYIFNDLNARHVPSATGLSEAVNDHGRRAIRYGDNFDTMDPLPGNTVTIRLATEVLCSESGLCESERDDSGIVSGVSKSVMVPTLIL